MKSLEPQEPAKQHRNRAQTQTRFTNSDPAPEDPNPELSEIPREARSGKDFNPVLAADLAVVATLKPPHADHDV